MCKSNGSEETAYYSALLQHYTKVNSEACSNSEPSSTPHLAIPYTPAALIKAYNQYVLTDILQRLTWSWR